MEQYHYWVNKHFDFLDFQKVFGYDIPFRQIWCIMKIC